MFKKSVLKLAAIAFTATIFSGSNLAASPIWETVIPDASCEITKTLTSNGMRINAVVYTRDSGRGNFEFILKSKLLVGSKRDIADGVFRSFAGQTRTLGSFFVPRHAQSGKATMHFVWDDKDYTCPVFEFGNRAKAPVLMRATN